MHICVLLPTTIKLNAYSLFKIKFCRFFASFWTNLSYFLDWAVLIHEQRLNHLRFFSLLHCEDDWFYVYFAASYKSVRKREKHQSFAYTLQRKGKNNHMDAGIDTWNASIERISHIKFIASFVSALRRFKRSKWVRDIKIFGYFFHTRS